MLFIIKTFFFFQIFIQEIVDFTEIEHSADQQHRSGESKIISQPSDRRNASGDKTMQKKFSISYKISKSWRWFYSCINSRNIYVLAVALFISLSITVGVLTICLTAQKTGKTCQLEFKRTMKSSLISNSQPRSVAVGDLNNDHQIDMVVANSGTNTIGIFLSEGDGTFADQKKYSTGSDSQPYSVVIGDFNNDSYVDIVFANYGTNNVGIFLGNGNGTFKDQRVFSLGSSHPLFITSSDFNQDHRMDIVVVNYGTNSIGILLGYGNGSFQDQTTYSTGYDSLPYSLAVGDFNKDNRLDIVVANYGTNNIGIYLGYGNGTFVNQQIYTTLLGSNPSSIAVGDFNSDNQLDIVVSNNGTSNVGIFLGLGNGTFLAQTTYSIGPHSHPQYVSVGDFNGDNALDVVVVDSTNDQVHILPGYGNGSFATITTYDDVAQSEPFCIGVADLNNDNKSDIVVVNRDTNNILVLIDYSSKPSARETNYYDGEPTSVNSVAVNDFNNDHIRDIVFRANTTLRILIGLGNGTFDSKNIYSIGNGFRAQYVCVGDLNNDNRMDIVTANSDRDTVGIFLGYGDGTFHNMTTYWTGIHSTPWWIALGDFNHDNRLDIISANRGTNTIGVLLGHGDGTFAAMVNYSTVIGIAPFSVAVGYISNDSHLDFVVADQNDVAIVFLGHGDGTFTFMKAYKTGENSDPTSIALADFNGDNHLDIVIANTNTYNVGVFLGYGDGTFGTQTDYITGSAFIPYYVIVDHFNNDNIYDIGVTNFGNGEVVIFYGYGNGSFEFARRYSTGYGSEPYGIAVVDFDNNTQWEIVVALQGTGDITVLTEYNIAQFANPTKYSTDSAPRPYSVAVSDFNNDNRADIVVANSGTDNLGILLGSGNGTFGVEMTYSIGSDFYPQYVITCDVNKDSQQDIVSVNSKMNSISVILGYGNGTFAEQIMYPTGDSSHPYAVVAGDFNNDTRLDLGVVNEGTDSIVIFLGFNYTFFHWQEIYSSIDSLGPTGMVVNDFNNDTFLDIAAVFQSSNTLGILLGYGNGSFIGMINYPIGNGSQPADMAMGDFNNDNYLDIVTANLGTNNVGVFLGYGNGSFAPIMIQSIGNYAIPNGIAVSDFNKDSRLDIVVAYRASDSVGVLLGYGNGSFSIVEIYSTGKGSSSSSVTVGDFNNDSNSDIAVANADADNVGVLLGFGNGTFENQMTFATGKISQPFYVIIGDFNNDNQLDIATANRNTNSVGILIGYGNGTFATIKTYSSGVGSGPKFIRAGDFNSDRILDIAVINYGTNNFAVLFGLGDGSFLLGRPVSTGVGSQPFVLAIGDFNNDTRLDIAVGTSFMNNIAIFLANGSEPFGSGQSYSIGDGSKPHSIATGDFDHDGRLDIVVANYGTGNVGILLGYSDSIFEKTKLCLNESDSAPSSVAVGDLNNDTYLDIVVAHSGTDNIEILLGCGNGSFAIGTKYSTGAQSCPYTVTIGDFNNDNRSDIAVANSAISNILLLYGHGDGTFENTTSYPLGYEYFPYSLAVKDLNQDHWLDIVIACYSTDHIETLIKMC